MLVYSTHSKLDKLSARHRLWHASFSSPTLKITALLINPAGLSHLYDTKYATRLQYDPEDQGKLSCCPKNALAGIILGCGGQDQALYWLVPKPGDGSSGRLADVSKHVCFIILHQRYYSRSHGSI